MSGERETTDEAGWDQLPDWARRWPLMLQLIVDLHPSAPDKAAFLASALQVAAALDSSTRELELVLRKAVRRELEDAASIGRMAGRVMDNRSVLRSAGYELEE